MVMATERWQQIKEIFHSALEQGPAERSAYLARACAGDEAIRSEVESLIAAHEKEGSFIDSPAYEVAAAWLADDDDNHPDSLVGQQVNHYKVLSELGSGGMGEVYLAQDTKLGRKIALKLLPASFTNDPDRLHRFQQEARTASALNHPNILTIYEIGDQQGRPFIATELIEGQTLRGRLASGTLELTDALDIVLQAASALAAAHEVGIVHRDVKPENIMLRRDGYVKVLDFGLAKLAEPKARRAELEAPTRMHGNTSPGMVMGTVNYMSPEQARGLDVDERTDIWSLGVVLYEMLTGSAPFKGETPTDVTVSILERDPVPLLTLSEDIPAELDWIVKKALRKDQDERYQTVKEMAGDLRGIKQELEFEAKLERSATTVDKGNGKAQASLKRSPLPVGNVATNRTVVIPTDEIKEALAPTPVLPTSRATYGRTPLIAALAVILLAVAGFAFYKLFLQGTKVATFQASNITRLTNNGKTVNAAISPDGKYFVYTLSDAGRQSIWLRQTSAYNDTLIVPPAQVGIFGMTFSRDGNELYYVIKANDAGTLYKIPLLGGTPVKLLERIDCPVSFSPDGARLAFIRGDYPNRGESGLFIANSDGGNVQQIAARRSPEFFSPINFTGPSWSPDGELIAASVTNLKSESSLIIFNLKDGKEETLTRQPWLHVGRVEWLPGTSGLLMVARDQASGGPQIWQLSYPGGEARKITNDLSLYRGLSLTADGNSLLTIQAGGLVNMWLVRDGDSEHAVKVQSENQVETGQLANAVQLSVGNLGYLGGNEGISWTPDNRIVFTLGNGKHGQVWLMNADESNRKQLTFGTSNNHNPVVSSDGRYIVFTSDRSNQRNVWRMNIDGSDVRQLTNDAADFLPAISPDNQWVIYSSFNAGKLTLWKVPLAGGTPVEMTNREGINPTISPDGKLIAYLFTEAADPAAPPNRIAIIPFEGGEPVKTFEVPPGLAGQRTILAWSRDGRSLLYTAIMNNVSNIWRQPLDGGKPVQVTNFRESLITAFDWSRDGRQLACARGILIRDAVLISNSK